MRNKEILQFHMLGTPSLPQKPMKWGGGGGEELNWRVL